MSEKDDIVHANSDPRVLFLYLLLRDAAPMGEVERILMIIEEAQTQRATFFDFSDLDLVKRAIQFEGRLKIADFGFSQLRAGAFAGTHSRLRRTREDKP